MREGLSKCVQLYCLDLVDKNVQVIVKLGKGKAYALTMITETDRYFSDPAIIQRIADSLELSERGELE